MRLEEYRALLAKVDGFFARVHGRYGAQMKCAEGCSECCGVQLTLSPVEAEALREHLATLPESVRARLAARAVALEHAAGPCPALDANGRCDVYEARPLICRTHGVPMRTPRAASLPVLDERDGLAVCHLNFEGMPLDEVDADCVLALESIDALLGVVNARAVGEGEERLARIPIGDVLFSAHHE
jgi:hypothetical protein